MRSSVRRLVVAVLVCAAARGAAAQVFEIPEARDTPTMQEFRRAVSAYLERTIGAEFHGVAEPEDRRAASSLDNYRRAVDRMFGLHALTVERRAAASSLMPKDATYIVVNAIMGDLYRDERRWGTDTAGSLSDGQVAEAAERGPMSEFLALVHGGFAVRNATGYINRVKDAGRRALRDAPKGDEHARVVVYLLRSLTLLGEGPVREAVGAWRDAGVVDAWTAAMLIGMAQRAEAGASGTTDEQGAALLARAGESLLSAESLANGRPESATELMRTAALLGAPIGERDAQGWFSEAVSRQFDWFDAYDGAIDIARRSVDGADEAWFEFGVACAKTERFDTLVPWRFVTMVDELQARRRDTMHYALPEVCETFTRVIRESQKSGVAPWLPGECEALRTFIALENGDFETAWKSIDTADAQAGVFFAGLCRRHGTTDSTIRSDLLREWSGVSNAIETALARAEQGDPAGAVELLRRAEDRAADHPVVRANLKHLIAPLDWRVRLAKGETVDLGPTEEFSGWERPRKTHPVLRPDGMAEFPQGAQQSAGSLGVPPLGELPLEIIMRVELVHGFGDNRGDLVLSLYTDDSEKRRSESLTFIAGPDGWMEHRHGDERTVDRIDRVRLLPGVHEFRLHLSAQRTKLWIDGELALDVQRFEGDSLGTGWAIRGVDQRNVDAWRFGHVTVRRIE